MTARDIRGHLEEHCGVAVLSDLMSWTTDAVLGEAREWQNRPLHPVYLVVSFDALRVKIREEDGLPWRGAGVVDRADRGGPSSGSR